MKKHVRSIFLLLTLAVLISALPVDAAALDIKKITEEQFVDVNPFYADVFDEKSSYWVSAPLATTAGQVHCETLEDATETLRESMKNREASISVSFSSNLNYDYVWRDVLYDAFEHTGVPDEGDYLYMHYGGCSVTRSVYGGTCTLSYSMKYDTTAEQETEMDSAVDELLAQLNLDGKNDYQKVKAIYDYMCSNISYDHANLDDDTYMLKFSAYAALVNGTAVCQGYANLFYRLALEVGVDARLIPSQTVNHAWNIVELGDVYYNLDATWDAGSSVYNWFLLSDPSFSRHPRDTSGVWATYSSTEFYMQYPIGDYDFTATPCIVTSPTDLFRVTNQADTSFAVKAQGALKYQWQFLSSSGVWKDTGALGNQTSTLSVVPSPSTNGNQYRCAVTGADGTVVYSEAATLYVSPGLPLAIVAQPQNVTVKEGETATFSVTAEGEGLTYQWQFLNSKGEWKSTGAKGNKAAALEISASTSVSGNQYRCKITDDYGNVVYSRTVDLTVNIALSITSQSTSATVYEGEYALFSIEAEGKNLTYQWQFLNSKGVWKNTGASGNKTATLKIAASESVNGNQYRCIVTNGYGSELVSDVVTLTVEPQPPIRIISQPADLTVAEGERAAFTVTAEGEGLTYQWQFLNSKGVWKNTGASGNKTAVLKIAASESVNGNQYRCVITDADGNEAVSDAATLVVELVPPIRIVSQPAGLTVAEGERAAFTVTAEGEGLTYQWQFLSAGGVWKNTGASGNKSATLKIAASESVNGNQYRCVIADADGHELVSNAVTLTVELVPAIRIISHPVDVTVDAGETAKFTVTATGSDLSYQWQFLSASGTWKNTGASGNKTATLKVTAAAGVNGNQYRCVITDGDGNKVISDVVVLTVR